MARDSQRPVMCYCTECGRAKLVQYDTDPVIAICDNGERNVASAPVMCKRSIKVTKVRCIENLPKKIGL